MAYRIALIGGGSGGHVYPLVAVAEELQKQALAKGTELEMQIWGDGDFIKNSAAELAISYKNIKSPKLRRYFSVNNFLDFLKIPLAIFQSFFYAWLFMPDIVFAKGGYASFIPSWAAKIFMIPIFIHESDAVPGFTNRLLSKLAKRVYISFETSRSFFKNEKTYTVGNPTRPFPVLSKEVALKFFQISNPKPVVLVVGGSQGAQIINEVIINSIAGFVKEFNIIHQTGVNNFNFVQSQIENIIKESEKSPAGTYGQLIRDSYKAYPFFDFSQMGYAYAAADVIVTRAGSGALFEIAAVGKPAIIIPILVSASNHQLANAKEFINYGAILIEEPNLTPHILIDQIKEAYKNRKELSRKITEFSRPDTAIKIAQDILGVS